MSAEDPLVARLRAAGCVFAEDEAALLREAGADGADLAALVDRRVAGQPLEHLLGWAEFCGRRVAVGPGVFTPRRRTEALVAEAVRLAPTADVVVDLCCGSGAIGAAVAAATGARELVAADVDGRVVRYAEATVAPVGGRVVVGDLYDPLPAALRGRVDLLVVNAPYVPTDAIALLPPEAREHEPRVALDGGPDGLELHRRVAAGAPAWLAPGGHLLIETSRGQADRTAAACRSAGLRARVLLDDERDATVVVARKAVPGRDLPGGDLPGRDLPGRDLPGGDLPGQVTNTQNGWPAGSA